MTRWKNGLTKEGDGMSAIRKIKRSVARANMKRAGMKKINHGSNGFRYVWRDWIRK